MNIIRFLRNQHQEVTHVLNEIIVRNDASESRSLLEKVSKMLRLHMQIEETIVYPAASRCFQGDLRKPSVLQSVEEHELARQCLSALESTPPTDEHFVPRAKVLRGILHEHILEEESDLFPWLATKLGLSGIDKLGDEIERQLSKLEAESVPRPASPAATEPPAAKSRSAKVAQTRRPATKSRSAKVAQTMRPTTKSRSAKVAQTRRPAARSSGAKVAQTRRQRSTVRGAKGSRRQATASRSTKRH
jgi:hemerythrin-like domain-containing protein